MAQRVDEDFGKGPGTHPVAAVLLFPFYLGARIQSELQPEKPAAGMKARPKWRFVTPPKRLRRCC